MKHIMLLLSLLFAGVNLAACGQKGPLTLPDPASESMVRPD
ncbi:MAG: lipoprotein [Pseudomonadota bacterium]